MRRDASSAGERGEALTDHATRTHRDWAGTAARNSDARPATRGYKGRWVVLLLHGLSGGFDVDMLWIESVKWWCAANGLFCW
jgi:hypothetical protein